MTYRIRLRPGQLLRRTSGQYIEVHAPSYHEAEQIVAKQFGDTALIDRSTSFDVGADHTTPE